MKKLLSLLLAVLLLLGCGAAMADTADREDFVGNWELNSISIMGITINRSELSYDLVCNIHEDDIIAFALDDSFFVRRVSYGNGVCRIEDADGMSELTIDEDGLLCLSLTSDGVTMNMRLQRAAASVPAPEIAPMVGVWKPVRMTMDGVTMSPTALGEVTATFYSDHYGWLGNDGEVLGAQLRVVDGKVLMDENNGNSPVTINEQGQLVFELHSDEGTPVMTVVFERVGDEPGTAAPAAAPAGEAATGQQGIEGHWGALTIQIVGSEVHVVGEGDIWLDVSGSNAVLGIEDNTYEFAVSVDDDVYTLASSSETHYCTVNQAGQLEMIMPDEENEIVLVFALEGAAAPAKETAPAAKASSFTGRWDAVTLQIVGKGMTVVGDGDIWLEFGDGTAVLYITGDTFTYTVAVEEDVCILSTNSSTDTATINADGQLELYMPGDGEPIIICFEPELLVTTGSVYDGTWELAELEMMGITLTAEEANTDTTLVLNGSHATMSYSEGTKSFDCVATVTDQGLELFDGSTTILFTLDERGLLCHTFDTDYGEMTVRLERQAD